ncbi:MAG TPA: hypothetical protein VFK05_36750, partial [Polyangiaceae bacterium]|nr:hypothetical protein [Polyangiaceae bacterium]
NPGSPGGPLGSSIQGELNVSFFGCPIQSEFLMVTIRPATVIAFGGEWRLPSRQRVAMLDCTPSGIAKRVERPITSL